MDTFEKFFEASSEQLPFTPETILRGMFTEVPPDMWERIASFPQSFDNKLKVKQYSVWEDTMQANELFIRKTFAMCATAMGYGTTQQMPKTIVEVFVPEDESDFDYGGQHIHDRKTSWSHKIEINLKEMWWYDGVVYRYFWNLLHEMAHSLQVTQRRLSQTAGTFEGKPYDNDTEGSIADYESRPQEADANKIAKESLNKIKTYLKTGEGL